MSDTTQFKKRALRLEELRESAKTTATQREIKEPTPEELVDRWYDLTPEEQSKANDEWFEQLAAGTLPECEDPDFTPNLAKQTQS